MAGPLKDKPIELTRNVFHRGEFLKEGQVVTCGKEVSEEEGAELIKMNKAQFPKSKGKK